MNEYEGFRRVRYGDAQFVPVCPTCGRFVKADSHVSFNGLGDLRSGPNATCKRCGRVEMLFEGFIGEGEE